VGRNRKRVWNRRFVQSLGGMSIEYSKQILGRDGLPNERKKWEQPTIRIIKIYDKFLGGFPP